ncbi:plasmid pRiA4b ORF-3 family protein [Kitasatospora sp. NPDC101155]|uniref:plasmid pRiA4b ORF-3 family protein n=1 Tax=Kitasatospora sp. NPDC101155 TaxID=3364097 RepID=UPI0038107D12
MSGSVHQLKVTMPDIEPVVWRRIHVYSHTPLSGLHAVIQVAMGWDDAHLYQFGAKWEQYGHQASAYTVAQLMPEVGDGAGYVYDFGDEWVHQLLVEKIHRPALRTHYPRCSAGARACPPEDCGGPLGYERTLRAIRSRKGPRYRELREWGLHKYNPAVFDRDEVNRALSDPGSVGYPEPAPWRREVLDLSSRYPGAPAAAGQGVDHPESDPADQPEAEPAVVQVHPLALATDQAAQAVRDALQAVDVARANLAEALRREHAANELAKRVHGAMSRPLVLKALGATS